MTSAGFQQLDSDYTVGDPIQEFKLGSAIGQVPIIRLFGVSEEGNSIQCNVHGFTSYFFIHAPANFQKSDCETFRNLFNVGT
jgi:DNA polymerase delta subunit 1